MCRRAPFVLAALAFLGVGCMNPQAPAPSTQPADQPSTFPQDVPYKDVEFPRPVPTVPGDGPKKVTGAQTKQSEGKKRDWNRDLAENPTFGQVPLAPIKPDREAPAVGLGQDFGKSETTFKHRKATAARAHADRIAAALQWLVDHQDSQGFWSADTFPATSKRTQAVSTGNIEFVKPGEQGGDFGWDGATNIGLTGLGLLAFTANGYDHKSGDRRNVLRSAILYLRKTQTADGCFGPQDENLFVYNHAIATTALAELYGLTADPVLKPILDHAAGFIVAAQNPGLGWRYGVQTSYNDSSVAGWMLLALHSASQVGIALDASKVYGDAFRWFDLATIKVDGSWHTGYDFPGSNNARLRAAQTYESNPTMDAIHGAVRMLTRETRGAAEQLADFEQAIATNPPKWEHNQLDYYYWFWATLFLQQHAGKNRDNWWKTVSGVLTKHQRGWHELDTKADRTTAEKLAEHGSWDAVDAWSTAGGRVYATAINVLTLSMPWRFSAEPADPETPKEK